MTHRTSALLLAALLFGGCGGAPESAPRSTPDRTPGAEGAARPWTGRGALDHPRDFRFVVVSDRTGGHREGVFASAMPRINLVAPDFVVSVGDFIEGYSDDTTTLNAEWSEVERHVGRLRMPFFYTVGNHDMSNETMAREWQHRFGPSYYSFVVQDVHFLVLNSELFGMVHDPRHPVPGPWTQSDQLEFARATLAEHANARWTFVLVHQPLWDGRNGVHPDWEKIEAMLGDRPFTVFAGHTHDYTQHVRRGRQYITLATTGGASGLRGIPFGEFDHIAHVSMTDDGPVIANLMLDGIHGTAVRTEAVRAAVRGLEGVLRIARLVGSGPQFRDGIAHITVSNPGTAPVRVIGRLEAGRDIAPLVDRIERTVPGGGVAEIAVPYQTPDGSVPYERIAPASIEWTLSTRVGDVPVEIARVSSIHPERDFPIQAAPGAITVDGRLDDWERLPFVVQEPGAVAGHAPRDGAADSSFRFGLATGDHDLYVAVEVRDDSLVAGPDRTAREQDHVALSIDARPDPERSANRDRYEALSTGGFRKLIQATIPLGEAKDDPILALFGIREIAGTAQAARRTANGYAVEFSVPLSRLDEIRGAPWDALRMNVAVTDYDEAETGYNVVYWRPNRFSGDAPEGSGTFVRR